MKIKTVQKLIFILKQEIDSLLTAKALIDEKIIEEEYLLESLKSYLKREIELITKENVAGFDISVFIRHELGKQNQKELEINLLNEEKNNLINKIIDKNLDKKTYEHMLEAIIAQDRIKEDKAEMAIIDSYSLIRFNNIEES